MKRNEVNMMTNELLRQRNDLIDFNHNTVASADQQEIIKDEIFELSMQVWRTIPKDQIKSTRY
jgi:hypothetical protein